ncbi:MAG: TonB-dependent receptor [Bacteroidales bacterium]|nr:TonB-dependent receptor [Bacteroidales bacterium]
MKRFILTLISAFAAIAALAQGLQVSGTVKDENGEPLVGAYVIVKGTTTGNMTMPDGTYTLNVPAGVQNPVLVFTFLGYEDQEVAVGSRKRIDAVMISNTNDLQEAVVVGFGTQQKASITGAISNVGNDALVSTPTSDVTNSLSGRIPGLASRQESGRPGGDDATLYIRGRSSTTSTAPLVLVDGVERSLSQIPNDDIESISVLKDASATAVYGVRGANGVILVTTRRGQDGKARVSFSTEHALTTYNRVTECLSAYETARLQREGATWRGDDPSNIATNPMTFDSTEYDNYLYLSQTSPFTHPDNHFTDIFTKNGSQHKYNVNVSGGNKAIKYFVSVGYFNQDGMFQTDVEKLKQKPTFQRIIEAEPSIDGILQQPNYDASYYYKRITTRANLDIQLTKRLDVQINLAYISGQQNRPGGYDNLDGDSENMRLFGMFYRNAPQAFALVNQNGSMGGSLGVWRQNPLVTLCYTGFKRTFSSKLQDNMMVNLDLSDLLDGLRITGNFSYDASWGSWWGVIQRPYIYDYNDKADTYTQGLAGVLPSRGSGVTAATYHTYAEAALRYKHTFAEKHNVNAVVLGTYTSNNRPNSGNRFSYVPHVYKALIGRVNYNYMNKYLFEVNAGYNGSNRFAKGHQYQVFPAASLGWVITEEPWMKPAKNVLSFAKIRSSYGIVGNDNLGNFSYYYLSSYGNGEKYSFGETWQALTTGLVEGKPANLNISWEVSRKFDAGIDTKWAKNRLSLNADYFFEKRTGILNTPANFTLISGMTGMSPDNIGVIINRGYELEANYADKIGDFRYNFGGNISYAHNTIIKNGEADQPYDYMYSKGHSIGQFSGYHVLGFFESYEDIAASPTQFGLSTYMPGDVKYADINGDGVVDDNDQAKIGFSNVPELTFAWNFGFNWKGIDFSILFQGATRSTIRIYGDLGYDNIWGNYYSEHRNRWTPETAATATYPRLYRKSMETLSNYFASDFWLYDGSYLRLKNVQIGYTFPKKVSNKLRINNLRVYANGYNLMTWDHVGKVDPESPNTNGYFYPQQIIYNCGLSFNF